MQLTVQGKQMDVGDALRTHATDKLEDINAKYFNRAIDTVVTFSKEGHGKGLFRCHISIRVGKNIMVVSDNAAGDPYVAFEESADKIAKQLRRYKRKLRDHHERQEQTPELEIIKARDYTIASSPDTAESEEEESDGVPYGEDPVIVAETAAHIETLSVSDAVMRMDLSGQNAMLFRNPKHKGINLVYRRPDGNVGWVDLAETA
jgi:ribosomal subunit interface protein